MKQKVTVTVVYPVTFQTEIDTEKEIYELREQIKNQADVIYEASSVDSVIHQCDEFPELVE
jgi:hypothetical protein